MGDIAVIVGWRAWVDVALAVGAMAVVVVSWIVVVGTGDELLVVVSSLEWWGVVVG